MPTLFVGNVPASAQRDDLERIFQKYGRVVNCTIRQDARGGPLNYAFVEFEDEKDAEDARLGLNGHEMEGSRLRVDKSRSESAPHRDNGPRPTFRDDRPSDFPPRPECTVIIENLPDRASWQVYSLPN